MLKEIASFARWRLVPMRYATRLMNLRPGTFGGTAPSRLPASHAIETTGFTDGPTMDPATLAKIDALYRPRIAGVEQRQHGHPFANLLRDDDFTIDNPLMRLVFSPGILDVAFDYFGGSCLLDSIQLLFSWPTGGELRESQKWHLDYADTKSLHYIAYLNDVRTDADGPFVCVDRSATRKVGRSLVIRRIEDERFEAEAGGDRAERFCGPAGASMLIDPAACYHYGSRCRTEAGRLAVFITFSSNWPFVKPQPAILRNREQLLAIGRKTRPDLDEDRLRKLLMMPGGQTS